LAIAVNRVPAGKKAIVQAQGKGHCRSPPFSRSREKVSRSDG
jgi:hypothetical protein